MTAAVLSIGTELTRGELVNTNAAWLCDQLTMLGCEVTEQVTVPDRAEAICDTLRALCARNTLIVCTGGLGPTTDDITSASVALAAGVALERREASLEVIRRRYAARGREMTPSNAKQADFPEGAVVIPNPVGTAPGFSLSMGDCRGFFLPGVPTEMMRLFEDTVRSEVASTVKRTTHQIRLRTFGLSESVVGERLDGIEAEHPGVSLGYRASFPEIEVKVCARADEAAEAARRVAVVVREVRSRLGDAVYSEGEDSYAAFVGRGLRAKRLTLALAESCTGGMISSMLTDVAGSSDYLLLNAVTYSNASKTKLLGVREEILRGHGAVSAECAAAMAAGARRLVDSDLGVSVTGIAGPGGGSEDRPVGTVWMGVARREGEPVTELFRLDGDRAQIRRRTAYLALQLIVRAAQTS